MRDTNLQPSALPSAEAAPLKLQIERLSVRIPLQFLPKIHFFDATHCVFVMEFLESHVLLLDALFDRGSLLFEGGRGVSTAAAVALGEYLGTVHSKTRGSADAVIEAGFTWDCYGIAM